VLPQQQTEQRQPFLAENLHQTVTTEVSIENLKQVFLKRFRDPIRVPRIREKYHRDPTLRENRVPKIREIGSLQIHSGYLTFSLKKDLLKVIIKLSFRKSSDAKVQLFIRTPPKRAVG